MIDFNKVYRKNYKKFKFLMTRMLRGDMDAAEDIVQDCFVKALQFQESYDPKKGKIDTWMNSILFNCFRTHLKGKKADYNVFVDSIDPEDLSEFLAEELSSGDVEEAVEIINKVKNSKHRKVLFMHFVLGYTSTEISAIEKGVTQTNVTTIVARFKENL